MTTQTFAEVSFGPKETSFGPKETSVVALYEKYPGDIFVVAQYDKCPKESVRTTNICRAEQHIFQLIYLC